ncbi:phage baseplate assembly protein V [Enterobacter quasiroggenkampii]|uniref:phage baseplate assembly protein V n=1 Tax=Enterobacter quasiroggenkampii TaxID=2497436 RepID=UPI0021D3D77D|nr:phage baseplate assembly protein V [Enterobacter quasiroggenkampii]MCU6305308.1 phage baseplate assembly protein V [Enterobacter quasiroggenkampii]
MKPIKRLYLSTDEIHLADASLVLELNSCGRGFITAGTTQDYTGKLVRLDVGYTDLVLRWFTGYVERSQPAENGFQRLFVRELVGVFERLWPCSFQHPTLRDVASWLTEHSGLTISVPDAEYSDRPIPHFTHSGTGYQLLDNLGKAFGVTDYVWYQLPDGGVYVGGAEKALFADRPVEIPHEFNQGAAGGNSMTLPLVQSLRPGVELNGERVTKVHLQNDTMAVTWTPRNRATGQALQKTPVQRQIESHYPELASGMHLPKFARVMNPVEAVKSGNFSDPFRPRYAVDVQLLDADGNPDKDTPVYSAVPLPVPMAGNDSGMFQFPPEGTLVEIAFTGGRPDKPFVRQTVPEGTSLPDIQPGEQLQQQRAEVSQRVTKAGDWVRQTDQTISETSMARVVKADTEQRELVSRETTIKATDKVTVLGSSALMAGAIQQVCTGDYSQAVNNRVASIGGNDETDIAGSQTVTTGKDLIEKIGQIRKSVAAVQQQIIAPVVWIGSGTINVAQLMLDTLDVVKELAEQTASHTHSNTGAPTNAGAIRSTGAKADTLNGKYSPVIGK